LSLWKKRLLLSNLEIVGSGEITSYIIASHPDDGNNCETIE
jgi:hypothetical protein